MHHSSVCLSKPAKPNWSDVSTRGGGEGRQDFQSGWHEFAAEMMHLTSVLDVGAGLGLSRARLSVNGNAVTLQDPAPLDTVDVHDDVSRIPKDSYDAVTCFDVIEHVERDLTFVRDLCRIARRCVFLTTPNYNVSKAANEFHVREYTPREFAALVVPMGWIVSLFAGSPDGSEVVVLRRGSFMTHDYPHQGAMICL